MGGQKGHFFLISLSFLFLHQYSYFTHFPRSRQIRRCIQWVEIKFEASHSENSSSQRDQKQNRKSRRQTVRGRCKVFLISILECDFAWWEIKSKLPQAHWSYRGAIVRVRGPSSKRGCLVPGARVQPALPLCYHMKQISLWQAGAEEFTAAVKSQAQETAPPTITPPAATQPVTSLVSVLITKSEISRITDINFLVLYYKASARRNRASPQSALWFISRHTGMHRRLCFVVISHSSFLRGSKKWPHVFSVSLSSPRA